MALLGSQHQGGAQEGAYAGRPAQGKHHAEQGGGEEAHVIHVDGALGTFKNVHLDHVHKAQAEEDHHQAGYDVYSGLVRF